VKPIEAGAFEVDVTDHEAVDAMVARVVNEWGRVDILVANAGGGRGRPMDTKASTLDPALLWLVVDMNSLAPSMRSTRSPRSEAAAIRKDHHGEFGRRDRAISGRGMPIMGCKGRYRPLHAAFRPRPLGRLGITANCIAPGVIATGRIMATVIPGSSQSNREPGSAWRARVDDNLPTCPD
jgi:3-oxoacyl-[acyl-carrier protein] reductase